MITWIALAGIGVVLLLLVLLMGSVLKNGVPLFAEPGFSTRLGTYLSTNVAETREDHPFAELHPRQFDESVDALYSRTLSEVEALGWEIAEQNDGEHTLSVVITTPIMGYKDDLTIRVKSTGDEQSTLYLRSESRVGRGDMGANLSHVLTLYEALGSIHP